MPAPSTPLPALDATTNAEVKTASDGLAAARTSTYVSVPQSLQDLLNASSGRDLLQNLDWGIPEAPAFNPVSDVRIGWTTLTIPPPEIDISESRYNDEISMLRSRGNALVKTGRGHIKISMPLEFAALENINNELREIVAQFRLCPVTTIESDFISTTVATKRWKIGLAVREEVAVAAQLREAAFVAYKKSRDRVIDIVVAAAAALGQTPESLRTEAKDLGPDQLSDWVTTSIVRASANETAVRKFWGTSASAALSNVHADIKALKDLHTTFLNASAEHVRLQATAQYTAPSTPVIMHTMTCQTVPGYPQRVQGELEMFYFNTDCFMPSLMFNGTGMNPTPDITQSGAYWEYFHNLLGEDARAGPDSQVDPMHLGVASEATWGFLRLDYPTTHLKRVKKVHGRALYTESDQSIPVPPPIGHASDSDYEWVTTGGFLELAADDEKIIVSHVAVVLENRLAPQPIEGQMYGTFQYVGQANAKVRVTLTVSGSDAEDHNLQLMRIHEVKLQTEQVALKFDQKARRNVRIVIDHDLVRLFGVRYVLLDDIRTRTTGINTSEVTLLFTEYTTSQDQRERLLLTAPQAKEKMDLNALEYMVDLAQAEIHRRGRAEIMDLVNANVSEDRDRKSDAGVWAVESLYGLPGEDRSSGILTPRVLEAYLLQRMPRDIYWDPSVLANAPNTAGSILASRLASRLALTSRVAILSTAARGPFATSERLALDALDAGPLAAADYKEKRSLARTAENHRLAHAAKIAQKYLTRWGRRYLRADTTSDAPMLTDIDGIVIGDAPDRSMLKDLLKIIMDGSQFSPEQTRLRVARFRAERSFPTLEKRNDKIRKSISERTTYPDLLLPTYAQAYKTVWAKIQTETRVDPVALDDLNTVRLPSNVRTAVAQILPSYDDLGVRPPFGKKTSDFARRLSDIVEPDFFFFWKRAKSMPVVLKATEAAAQEAGALIGRTMETDIGGDRLRTALKLGMAKTDIRARASVTSMPPANMYPDPAPSDTVYSKIPGYVVGLSGNQISIPNYDDMGDKQYVPANPTLRKSLADINPQDAQHRKRLFQESVNSTPDRFQRMVTVFPTFQVYLLETDQEEFSLWDDWYGYNAIKSIRVHHHKYVPDIAEIEIVNVTGNLDESRGMSSDQDHAEMERKDKEHAGEREKITGDNKDLDTFFLDAGTPIVIRLGYSTKASELETRFTGQVAAVNSGDIIRVVAQSYAAELTLPINKVFDGRSPLKIVDEIMHTSPAVHYGAIDLLLTKDRSGNVNTFTGTRIGDPNSPTFLGTSADDLDTRGTMGPISRAQSELGKAFSDRRLSNIYLNGSRNWRGAWTEGYGPNWGIPNVTGLEALHELARHYPGYVVATRPYDHQATLFFGKPEQPYFYTDTLRGDESKWEQSKSDADLDKKLEEMLAKLLSEFYADRTWGRMFSEAAVALRDRKILPSVDGMSLENSLTRELGRWVSGGRLLQIMTLNGYFGLFKTPSNLAEVGADLLYSDDSWRLPSSQANTEHLISIQNKIGEDGMRMLAGFFFNKYNDDGTPFVENATASAISRQIAAIDVAAIAVKEIGTTPFSVEANVFGAPAPSPGILLYYYHGWNDVLRAFSQPLVSEKGKSRATEDSIEALIRKAFGTDVSPEKTYGTAKRGGLEQLIWGSGEDRGPIAMTNGAEMNRQWFESMVKSLIHWLPVWRVFVSYFSFWLQTDQGVDLRKHVERIARSKEVFPLNPRMRRLRSHHFSHSHRDIVKNDIQTSQEFMANRVIIGYKKEGTFSSANDGQLVFFNQSEAKDTLELVFNDDIQPSDHRARVIQEPNAITEDRAYICAKTNLAEALRPMYRGQLMLRGNERIWPYDVVWVHDHFNGVSGPVEVETVIDSLDESGYYSTIIPHAVVWAESGSMYADMGAHGLWATWLGIGLLMGAGLALAPYTAGGSLFSAAAASSALYTVQNNAMAAKTGRGILDQTEDSIYTWLIGQSQYGGSDPGVRIVPLVKHGRPWTAGLKGIGSGGWKKRVKEKWENIEKGYEIVSEALFGG